MGCSTVLTPEAQWELIRCTGAGPAPPHRCSKSFVSHLFCFIPAVSGWVSQTVIWIQWLHSGWLNKQGEMIFEPVLLYFTLHTWRPQGHKRRTWGAQEKNSLCILRKKIHNLEVKGWVELRLHIFEKKYWIVIFLDWCCSCNMNDLFYTIILIFLKNLKYDLVFARVPSKDVFLCL